MHIGIRKHKLSLRRPEIVKYNSNLCQYINRKYWKVYSFSFHSFLLIIELKLNPIILKNLQSQTIVYFTARY